MLITAPKLMRACVVMPGTNDFVRSNNKMNIFLNHVDVNDNDWVKGTSINTECNMMCFKKNKLNSFRKLFLPNEYIIKSIFHTVVFKSWSVGLNDSDFISIT